MINKIKLYKPTIVWSKLNDHGSCGCEKCCWGPTASDGSSRVPLVFGCVPRMGGGLSWQLWEGRRHQRRAVIQRDITLGWLTHWVKDNFKTIQYSLNFLFAYLCDCRILCLRLWHYLKACVRSGIPKGQTSFYSIKSYQDLFELNKHRYVHDTQ